MRNLSQLTTEDCQTTFVVLSNLGYAALSRSLTCLILLGKFVSESVLLKGKK